MKQAIILLHGGLGSISQMEPIAQKLSSFFDVYPLNFSGHGGKPFSESFSIQEFSTELQDLISSLPETQKPVTVLGYSMGGYVAAFTALQFPELFSRLITLATKWEWDETTAQKECNQLDAAKIEAKVPMFAIDLEKRHSPNDWKILVSKSADLINRLGKQPAIDPDSLNLLQIPVLFISGDKDKTVPAEETTRIFRKSPNASMAILPFTSHPFEKVDTDLLVQYILEFCK